MTQTFKTFFLEQEAQEAQATKEQQKQAAMVANKVKELLSPNNIAAVVKQTQAKSIDELIAKLRKHPEIQKKLQLAKQVGGLEENMIWNVMKGIWDATAGRVWEWAKKSVKKTFSHIFSAFKTDAHFGEKALFAAILITMIGIPGGMLASGAGVAAAGHALGMGGGTFFGMMWFKMNILQPFLKTMLPHEYGQQPQYA